MKKLREIVPLDEIFDSHYDFKPAYSKKPTTKRYEFNSENHPYVVNFDQYDNHEPNKNLVSFGRRDADDWNYDKQFGKTKEEGKNSHKVFGTVKKIIDHHLKNNPEINHIHFSSDETSRTKLYDHMAKSFGNNHSVSTEIDGGQKEYHIKLNK